MRSGSVATGRPIRELRDRGTTYQAIADALNAEQVPTLRGAAQWRVSSVQTAAGYNRARIDHATR